MQGGTYYNLRHFGTEHGTNIVPTDGSPSPVDNPWLCFLVGSNFRRQPGPIYRNRVNRPASIFQKASGRGSATRAFRHYVINGEDGGRRRVVYDRGRGALDLCPACASPFADRARYGQPHRDACRLRAVERRALPALLVAVELQRIARENELVVAKADLVFRAQLDGGRERNARA